ncbi:sensor histidine kinase [Paenibacillus sp. FSL M8-0334]|uniref:HAMP domain-containing protein n=1 Tax=Paenibacillus campinasensis TaxID=66347 RepID=A0ABW9T3Q1_9BACL|nr:sensor histidine kinase [Paenibacillus campinasensis]MUG67923.1 HAMP domain-containing protein [Paenibacillus campinasensis]
MIFMPNNYEFKPGSWRRRFKRWTGFGDWPLQYKLIVLFLMIGILPSIALGVLVNWTVNRIVDEQMTANTLQLIGKVNQTLDNNMENLQSITYLIGFDPAVKRFLSGEMSGDGTESGEGNGEAPHALLSEEKSERYEIRQLLQGFTTLYPEIAAILVVNHEGDYISNEMYARSDGNLTEESWYVEAAQREGIFTVLGHPVQRNVTTHVFYSNDELISVVRSFVDPDTREVTGAVLIDLKLRAVAGAVRGVTLGKDGYLMVTARDGKPIYTPDHSPIAGIPPAWFPEEESGTFVREVGGQMLQFMYVTSSFTGWSTLGVFGASEAVHEVRKIQFYLVCFLFVVCLFGLTASYTLSQSISRPIRQLMSFMQKAESGDLTIRYWGGGQDEVGMLGRSFNRMLLQIRKLMKLSELRERQKREAELRSLQAHIKPHFLYNTLDTIHWMALKKGADDVSGMVESLSHLFRIGLSKGSDIIPIQDEWTHITSYLQIQKTRYRDRLHYELHLAPEAEGLYVLKLLLQPIVENAIYHGIKARRGPGSIVISAEVEEGMLLLTVTDNGAGMSPERLAELRRLLEDPLSAMQEPAGGEERSSRSYGLLNVQARIRLTFHEAYGIHIESAEGTGTRVIIRHPLLHTVPKASNEQGE